MEKMISEFIQKNGEGILFAALLVMIVLTIVQLHKINKMNRRITSIVKSVENYLSVIMEEDEPAEERAKTSQQSKNETIDTAEIKEREMEAQNSLISEVLQEIFP